MTKEITDNDRQRWETFRAELETSDFGFDIDDPAQAVTAAAWVVGPNIDRIANLLGRPRGWVAPPARALRHGGVWNGDRINIDGDEPDGFVLAMQMCVAAGWIEMVDA